MKDKIFVLKLVMLLFFPVGILISLLVHSAVYLVIFLIFYTILFVFMPGYRSEVWHDD